MNGNQSVIKRMATQWMEYKRQTAALERQARADQARASAEMELLIDEVKAEGYDPNSELGRAMLVELIMARVPQAADPYPYDSNGFRKKGL